ncbi:MAG: hypothetical protein RL518_1586 [Pseudomonadota bacterium]|jgi:Tfp pilus assembly PilM family ATPase
MRGFVKKWWYGHDPIVGIDIREEGVVLVVVDLQGAHRSIELELSSTTSGGRGGFHNQPLISAALKDFVGSGRDAIRRCAVALPEGLTYISRISLPAALWRKPEHIRYEAALEQVYLRPSDVRGKLYPLKRDPQGKYAAILVAAKVTDVQEIEEAIAKAGIEISYLTPRVFVGQHPRLARGDGAHNGLVAHCDLYATPPHIHVFSNSEYELSLRDWSPTGADFEKVSLFVVNGPHESEAAVRNRYPASRVVPLSSLVLPPQLVLDPKKVVAAALSLWETQLR